MDSGTRGILTKSIFSSPVVRWAAVVLLVGGLRLFGMAPAVTEPASQPTSASSSQSPAQSATQSSPPAQSSGDQKSPEQKSGEQGAENGDIPRIKVGTNEVNVVFTVTDKHGKRVTDLRQADFHFVDDSKPAAEIRSFHAETNLPLQVGLLIDASNSVRDRFKFEQESAIEFLNQTIHPRYDRAFVVG